MSEMGSYVNKRRARALSRNPVAVRKVCINSLPSFWRASEVLESARSPLGAATAFCVHNGNGVCAVETDS